jgi:Ring finger domain
MPEGEGENGDLEMQMPQASAPAISLNDSPGAEAHPRRFRRRLLLPVELLALFIFTVVVFGFLLPTLMIFLVLITVLYHICTCCSSNSLLLPIVITTNTPSNVDENGQPTPDENGELWTLWTWSDHANQQQPDRRQTETSFWGFSSRNSAFSKPVSLTELQTLLVRRKLDKIHTESFGASDRPTTQDLAIKFGACLLQTYNSDDMPIVSQVGDTPQPPVNLNDSAKEVDDGRFDDGTVFWLTPMGSELKKGGPIVGNEESSASDPDASKKMNYHVHVFSPPLSKPPSVSSKPDPPVNLADPNEENSIRSFGAVSNASTANESTDVIPVPASGPTNQSNTSSESVQDQCISDAANKESSDDVQDKKPDPPESRSIQNETRGDSSDSHPSSMPSCDICMLEYEEGDIVAWSRQTSCCHTFHADCIAHWLLRKPTCPSCRHPYVLAPSA